MHTLLIGLVVVACLLEACVAVAQTLTGSLIGTVKDAQGNGIEGATVRVTSPRHVVAVEEAITNAKGQFLFRTLHPGRYMLEIEAPGLSPYHDPDIDVGVGATIERRIVLKVEEFVVVEGTGLEARSSGSAVRVDREAIETFPTHRFGPFPWIGTAAGVSAVSPGSSSINSVSVFGSGTNENLFLQDDTNYTCPCSGEARSETGVDFIQDVQVLSVGASAEFGNMQGGVINVITRRGGDRVLSDVSYYGQPGGLTSQPVRLAYGPAGPDQPTSGYTREKYRDFTTTLGGPIRRERLWFFAGYEHLRDYDSQPGTDPALPRTYEQDKIFAKLTWRFSPGLQLEQSFHDEFWVNPEIPTLAKPIEATQRRHASVPAITFGHLTHTVSSNTVWDVRAGMFKYSRKDDPSTGNLAAESHFDSVTGLFSGAPQTVGGLELVRATSKGTINHYQPGMMGADHQWRFGGQIERGEHQLSTIVPTGTRFIDRANQPFQTQSADPSIIGGVFITAAGFVSDAITIGDALTINAGVRFDHSRAVSQDLPAIDGDGRETGEIVRGSGTLYTWNVWSPRLGVTLKLRADGRTVLRGSYGRFNQGVLTGELAPFHPGATPMTTAAWNPATNGYTTPVSVVDPRNNLKLDSEVRAPRTDEYSVGVDREIARGLTVRAAYVREIGDNFIGWTDVGGVYSEEARSLPDGRTIPVWVLVNNTADRLFLLTNPEGYSLTYNGLTMAAEKRLSNGWQAVGSYTWSRASGLQVSSGASAAAPQVSTIAGSPYLTFGQDPNNLTNARGLMPNDRPHMIRFMGSYEVPRTGILMAGNLQHLSGKPWASTAQVRLAQGQGDQRILLEPRGSRRLSSQTLLDLRISKAFSFGGLDTVELLVDVLNLLNDTGEEGLATDNLFSPTFGQPTLFVDPRRIMVGVRLNLGR